ncbi:MULTISPECIES: hypothetical protein [unclassified Bacillus (in: firmicutes)]|uniref:hypothetical protein n=1 Tax=unclassified Bacillus (in: firmicutes) TaxID=185979 RepID=UPI0019129AC5|nr:hypothetical protein [Bacillus sp. TH12]MBK5504029.1 hypothetical protein [Bacillus sp. TH12]MBK5513920.1 hypothetical protein [Bacillus sp. TH11]
MFILILILNIWNENLSTFYSIVTYELTLSTAKTLAKLNPNRTFIYVSGSGTDSTESGRTMWARVKERTENELLRLPFKSAYMFRLRLIIPANGVKSKTKLYQLMYDVMKPFNPLLKRFGSVITSEQLGRAMVRVGKDGYSRSIIESSDLKKIGK